ncbi:MAG: sulfatase-like hydrolase/transferase [Polyangiaceae bacterium]
MRSDRWLAQLDRMRVGARCGAGAAIGLWLADVASLAPWRAEPWKVSIVGLGAALHVALTTGLIAGALLGPLLVPAVGKATESFRALLTTLRRNDPEVARTFAARALSIAFLAPVWGYLAYRGSLVVMLSFARPESIGLMLVASYAVFALTLLVAWPWVNNLLQAGLRSASRLRGLGWVTARPWPIPAAIACVVGAVLAFVLTSHRAEVVALPWRQAAPLAGLVVGAAWAVRSRSDRTVRIHSSAALVAGALIASGLAAWSLRPDSTRERWLAFDAAWSGRAGDAAWTAAFDFDRDGQLNILGGGDCAPFDARRYTGAIDIPGNGIDEDCDGQDLTTMVLRPRRYMPAGQHELPSRPSIVLITVDALAAPRLSSLGGARSRMPHIDALARTSALFTHAFSQGPSTRLSFPSMFTSRWDSELTHVFTPHLPYSLAASDRQLQDVLGESGYQTAAVIPNTYFDASHWASMTRGFQRVDVSALTVRKNNAALVTDAALRELGEAADRPLYMWVHYYDAHGPYTPVPGAPPGPRSEEDLYDDELGLIDGEVGRLLAAIDARGGSTYVFFTADHASVFHPSPTRRGHYGYDLFSATLHVPLIVHGPGIPASRVKGVVSTMDVAPTIADLLRIPVPQFEGTSLWPEMLKGEHDPARFVFHEFYLPERKFRGEEPLALVSVRNDHYNLVLDRLRGQYALYDWNADYFEESDLFGILGHTPEVVHLRSVLAAFIQQHDRHEEGLAPLLATSDRR